jgi:hypothetical protein
MATRKRDVKNKQSGLRDWEQITLYSVANAGVWLLGSGIVALLFEQAKITAINVAIAIGFCVIVSVVTVAYIRERRS